MKKDNGKMRHGQRLYPDVVYRFNDIFQTVWQNHHMCSTSDDAEVDDVLVTPVFFSKSSRSFHWICLDSHMWNWEETFCSKNLTQFIEHIKVLKATVEGQAQWELFCKNQPGMDDYKAAIKIINDAIDDKNANREQIHRSILLLYSGFHHDAEKNIEGIFYTFLTTCSNHGDINRSDYLEGELRGNPNFDKFFPKDPCLALTSGDCKGRDCLIKKSGESGEIDISPEGLLDIFLIFVEYLLWHKTGGDNTFGNRIPFKNQIALLPLYDVWIGDRGYGGIKAVFIVFFDNDKTRENWLNNKLPKLSDAFQELAEEVTTSAETLATSVPISPPYDLVSHFLKALVFVQDWQSAAVFNNDGIFLSGYKRTQKDSQWTWEKGEKTDFDLDVSLPCSEHLIQEQDDQFDSQKHYYMWWTAGENGTIKLWSKEFIPGISDEEVSRFGNLSIRFEFPEATHIPSSEVDRKFLCQEYLRQQLDLMRMLIPKVRARRSALRNAAVSIMARNMSHNIGSHVLAAVRGDKDLKKDEDNGCKGGLKQVNRLNEHLQRRMDFIAELATVETLYAADNLLFQEILGVKVSRGVNEWLVNGDAPEDISGLNVQKLLLKHISGSQNEGGDAVSAEIHVICPDDKTVEEANVSFNSGVLGWQAFYVILENIIRNVAKHAPDPANPKIDIYLKVLNNRDNRDHDEFFEVRIWDRRKKADELVKGKTGITVVKYLAETLAQPRFLDDDNALATKDWGMKEIYISATFLRGIVLSDLENQLPKPAVIQVCAMDDNGKVKGEEKKEPGGVDNKNTYEHLGFKFYLPKAKNVAIIVDNVEEWWKSFDAVGEKHERTDMEKALKENGVDMFSVGEACTSGTKIPHRYGVLFSTQENLEKLRDWYGDSLSMEEILEKRRAELPLDLLKKVGMEEELTQLLIKDKVQEAIQYIRNEVLKQRLCRLLTAENDFKLWMEDIKLNDIPCGMNLDGLVEAEFGKAVVFDNHGSGIKRQLAPTHQWRKGCPSSPFSPERVKFAFYESHRSPFPQAGLFASLLLSFGKAGFESEALCAALTPVLILDERFQRIAAQRVSSACQPSIPDAWLNDGQEFFMGKMIWEQMRVFVPLVNECNLEQPKLEEIKKYLMGITENLGKGAFVVVHQTIFDKLSESGEKGLANHLAELSKEHDWINVVCSGRGVPWQLQDRDRGADYHPRFIALSALLQCLEHMPSKLHLVRLLEVTRAT